MATCNSMTHAEGKVFHKCKIAHLKIKINALTVLRQNERLTKQLRETSRERAKSQGQMLILSCCRMKINSSKIQCFKINTKISFSENTLLNFPKAQSSLLAYHKFLRFPSLSISICPPVKKSLPTRILEDSALIRQGCTTGNVILPANI